MDAALSVEASVERAEAFFRLGLPAIVSIHSINFHSMLRDFRSITLKLLDQFLTAVDSKWPDLLYLHDADLFSIATEGAYAGDNGRVRVAATISEER